MVISFSNDVSDQSTKCLFLSLIGMNILYKFFKIWNFWVPLNSLQQGWTFVHLGNKVSTPTKGEKREELACGSHFEVRHQKWVPQANFRCLNFRVSSRIKILQINFRPSKTITTNLSLIFLLS